MGTMTDNRRDHSAIAGSSYRAYEIGEDGKVQDSTNIFAASDDDAVEQVRAMADGRVVELWDRSRMVLRLPPSSE